MSEELLIRYCSPTLAGLKTANLFSCAYSCKGALHKALGDLNRKLGPKGLRVIPLRICAERALIYLYRPKKLDRDLKHEQAADLLAEYGYSLCNTERCVAELAERLAKNTDFPHEIGLFLGYPPEDVCGFIENKASCAKCVGCWKVYGDEEKAKQTFAKFDKCTAVYRSQWALGSSIERLTVAD